MEAVADVSRNLLEAAGTVTGEAGGSDTAPFFGFIGAASALVFACMCSSSAVCLSATNIKIVAFVIFTPVCRLWRSVRNRQVRRRYRVNGCPQT